MTVVAVPEAPPITTDVAIAITCPSWCTVNPSEHAADLWNLGGDCFHYSPGHVVVDCTRGPNVGPLDEPLPAADATVAFLVTTRPDGAETASPSFTISTGDTLSEAQFEALIVAMQQQHASYRAWKQALA